MLSAESKPTKISLASRNFSLDKKQAMTEIELLRFIVPSIGVTTTLNAQKLH